MYPDTQLITWKIQINASGKSPSYKGARPRDHEKENMKVTKNKLI